IAGRRLRRRIQRTNGIGWNIFFNEDLHRADRIQNSLLLYRRHCAVLVDAPGFLCHPITEIEYPRRGNAEQIYLNAPGQGIKEEFTATTSHVSLSLHSAGGDEVGLCRAHHVLKHPRLGSWIGG